MKKTKTSAGGGFAAIRYSSKQAKEAGGALKLYKALKSPNTCKTCAFGMGGKSGGMRNEKGDTLQVCKKSIQTQAQDMRAGIDPQFFKKNSVNDLSRLTGRQLEALGRLTHPLFLTKGGSHFQVLPWHEALDTLHKYWGDSQPERGFFYVSGRSSMEAAFLVQLIGRQWGTNNIHNCSYYCHQATGVGLTDSLGSGTSTVSLKDISRADLVVLMGANPASNHPRFMTSLVELRRRGGKIVVINPFKEIGLQRFSLPRDIRSLLFSSKIANLYIQPHCGGDLALLKAAMVLLVREKKIDSGFLENRCNNLKELMEDLSSEDLGSLLSKAGISYDELKEFCRYLGQSKNTIFSWALGVTQHLHGVQTVRAIANMALMRGMIGKPGAGLLPLRGHSNVQGVGTVGVVPELKPALADALLEHLGIQPPPIPGKDTFSCMEAAHKGEMDFAFLVGGNLYGSNPNQKWASEALANISFTAFMSTTLNRGHIHGHGKNTLILPVRARDEEKQATSQESMFNFVRLSAGGRRPPQNELPSETDIVVHAGKRLFGEHPIPWQELSGHHKIRQYIARIVPSLHPMADLDRGHEFTIPGRIKHSPSFTTANGKANLAVVQAVDANPEPHHFNLMTFRSEGQFNTIVYEEKDLYRGAEHRQVVFLHKNDMMSLNLSQGQKVWVESEIGRMKVELMEGDIREKNAAMYFPEANAIVPGKIDPRSKTPSFKRIPVKIYPA